MEGVRKGKDYMKWLLLFLCVIHIVLLLLLIGISINRYTYDIVSYTGILRADSEEVQTFLKGDYASYFDDGQEILKASGYGYSGTVHLEKRFVQRLFPVFLLCLTVDACIVAHFVINQKNEKKKLEKMANELKALELANEILQKDGENVIIKISRFEENLYHQLKTPVTGLKLTLEEMDGVSDPFALQRAKREADVLSRLISLLLKERQVSENKVRYHYEIEDFSLLVLEALEETEPLRKWKQKTIIQYGMDKELFVRCDGVWIKEAVVVLLENALESDAASISCSIEKTNGNIVLSVLSQGISIDQEDMDHLFERFYTKKDNHFGIGMHMARHIVLEHHGSLSAACSEKGVLFQLSLPLTDSGIYDVTDL